MVLAVPHLAGLAPARGDRAAGHGGALAPHRVAPVLALEESRREARPSPYRGRAGGVNPPDEPGESTLGAHTLWFQTVYVVFFIAHDRRTVMHVNVTAHPTAEWVWRR